MKHQITTADQHLLAGHGVTATGRKPSTRAGRRMIRDEGQRKSGSWMRTAP